MQFAVGSLNPGASAFPAACCGELERSMPRDVQDTQEYDAGQGFLVRHFS